MKKSLYIISDGELKRKDNTLYFETSEERKYIPVENTREILIFGEVSMNKRLLEFLTESEIIIHFFNYYGYYIGSFYPREHLNSGYMILKQAEHYLDTGKRLNLAEKFVSGAIENIKKVLIYYHNRGKELSEIISKIQEIATNIPDCSTTDELMAIEGNIRDYYYQSFDIILDNEHFIFETRTKRPPKNRINALISFANSLVYTTCLSEIYQTHLDPRIGYLHATNFRRFTLNLDVAEIFKPIIADRAIFSIVNKRIVKPQHFEKKLDGIVLNDKGKQILLQEMDERLRSTIQHKKLGRHVSYRQLIRLELYKIQKHLMEEEEYKPFVTGW
ncbi:type I-B CRISPR-associated endonuclease Cas1b [Thermodesulfovibrio yellowstonii]|uniref:CRISPR-associated endonuclease Cas1 2 n=2 Tax=Thermodesulfovibrio yellowstonii TaxID=28262 RepID=CAS1B_THEYD|nr:MULTISPECIES: type I-B CRISPR-associated endonuclease Cas1b [Thermodesulfovibrio]B5YL10.1 RecName: Full=CRISPR-associated endonuclease Cas1 2 [Thermodesulfovibrio yellowstonii DSM 11347]ACI20636.1 CRISPR-associated protein Cas1, HMARI/TNEAP subtype [Thermodesulfovibrio yellowstonii DSM 11347]MDI6864133.1 type I-B CRISPR-associated endonuclease Cas1b [Thermodesulfovibrio yellowstonii]GLI53648.1 CRISPR-associated endonuclease Cas1 2 [Thermodesulfovibrio islandicus]